MLYRRPIPINQLSSEASTPLARLTGLEGFARAILVGVLPLIALEAFGRKDMIALVYFASAIFTLLITVNIATLERLLQRRRLVVLGGLFLAVAVIFFYLRYAPLFALGLGMVSAGASIFSVCISLYIMDYIGKAELTRSETRRMLYTGTAWLIGPPLGVWLFTNSPSPVVFSLSALAALGMIAYFLRLRWGSNPVIRAAQSKPKTPLWAIIRYMSQTRLRIAYLITLSRSCFWVTLFVYGPIYVVEAGLPTWIGGFLLAGTSGLLFLSPLVRRLAEWYGTRQVIITCALLISLSMSVLGFIGPAQPIGLLFWITGALGGAGMDVLGNIPFMRLVKPGERTEMTMVFSTWREGSSLLTQALVFLTLLVAPFWVFYFVLSLLLGITVVGTSFLPRRI
jgi:MFS family permease